MGTDDSHGSILITQQGELVVHKKDLTGVTGEVNRIQQGGYFGER